MPWRTINHGLKFLEPGDTLYLRGGTYYENVYISLAGTAEAPVTVRSYPGELVVIDGGIEEFLVSPEDAWEPFQEGASQEYRSKRRFANIADVVGKFGDSMVGLQSYFHAVDLRSQNQLWKSNGKKNVQPCYCGPWLWYDRSTGYIHARLAHTHLSNPGISNYRGETDPRKLPLIVAPLRSVPLRIDHARNLRLQDIVIRGGGYDTVLVSQSVIVEFDNVVVWCGTYGMRLRNTLGLRFFNSALYGNTPPWAFRTEGSLMRYTGSEGRRDVARLTSHALFVAEGGEEFSVYCYPFNSTWEISYSEFTDSHDALYLGGVKNLRFHHNLVDNMHDDGIYLSPVMVYSPTELYIYQNLISRCLTAFAFGGHTSLAGRSMSIAT